MENKAEYQTTPQAPNPSPPSEPQLDHEGFPLPPVPPAVQYCLDNWKFVGPEKALIIQGRIVSLTAEWILKRGEYASETVRGYWQLAPDNLHCNIVVPYADEEITLSGGDLGVVKVVFRQLARHLDIAVTDVAVAHMNQIYMEAPPEKQRVDAKKRKEDVL